MEVGDKLINTITSIPGVENVVQRVQTFSLVSKDEKSKGAIINGIDINQEQLITDWNKRIVKGSLSLSHNNEVLLAEGLARYFNAELGDTLILFGQGYQGMMAAGKYKITGIVDLKNPQLNNLAIFMDIKSLNDYISSENIVTHLVIDKAEYYEEKKIAKEIDNVLSNDYEVMTWKQILPEIDQMITADNVGGLIMAFILYIVVCFGMFGTVLMMTEERKYEFGVLVSIGMSKIKLFLIIFLETIMLSSIGVAIGIILSRPIAYYFNKNPINLAEFGEGMDEAMAEFGFDAIVPFSISWDIPLSHALIIFFVSVFISIYPATKIFMLNPVNAMRK